MLTVCVVLVLVCIHPILSVVCVVDFPSPTELPIQALSVIASTGDDLFFSRFNRNLRLFADIKMLGSVGCQEND